MKYNTISLAVYGMPPVVVERYGADIIKPGMFCHLSTDGTVVPEWADAQNDGLSPSLVAVENDFLGRGVKELWTDPEGDYQLGDLVHFISGRPGDKFWAWLAPDQAVEIGMQAAPWGMAEGYPGTLTECPPNRRGSVGVFNENITNPPGSFPVRIEVILI